MKLSVITATFNSIGSLEAAINSILSGDEHELEYIIVDGASTDGTTEIIKNYAAHDERIKWVSEPDEGIADAFNKGVEMASGDWIGFVGSDDAYTPDGLNAIVEAAQLNPDASVLHGDLVRLDEEGRPLFIVKPSHVDNTIWHQMPINHPATFVARKAFDQIGHFDKHLKIAMDYDFILRLYKSGAKFVYVNKPITMMSYGGASDSKCMEGLMEVRRIKIREGYPRWRADYWFLYRYLIEVTKKLLRSTGLHGLLKLHPRFRSVG